MADSHAVTVTLGLETRGEEKFDAVSDKIANIKAQAGEATAAIQESMPKAAKAIEDVGAKTSKAVDDLRAKLPGVEMPNRQWEWLKPGGQYIGKGSEAAAAEAKATTETAALAASVGGLGIAAAAATGLLISLAGTIKVMSAAVDAAQQSAANVTKDWGRAQRSGEELSKSQVEASTGAQFFGRQLDLVQSQLQKRVTEARIEKKPGLFEQVGITPDVLQQMQQAGRFTPTGVLEFLTSMKEANQAALEAAKTTGKPEAIAAATEQVTKFSQNVANLFGRAMETAMQETSTQAIADARARQERAQGLFEATQTTVDNALALKNAFGELDTTMSSLRDRFGAGATESITGFIDSYTQKIQQSGAGVSDALSRLASEGFNQLKAAVDGIDANAMAFTIKDVVEQLRGGIETLGSVLQGLVTTINALNQAGQYLSNFQSAVQEFARDFGLRGLTKAMLGEETASKIFGKMESAREKQAREEAEAREKASAEAAKKAAAEPITPAAKPAAAAAAEAEVAKAKAKAPPIDLTGIDLTPAAAAFAGALASQIDLTPAAGPLAAAINSQIDLTSKAAGIGEAITAGIDLTSKAAGVGEAIAAGIDLTSKAAGVGEAITAGIDIASKAVGVGEQISAGVDFTSAASTVASTINSGVNFTGAAQAAVATLSAVNWNAAASAAGATIAAAISGAAAGIRVQVTGSVAGASVSSGGKPTGRDVPAGD